MRSLDDPTRSAIEAVWRIEAARVLGALVRLVRDVDLAEDLAHEALVAALEAWPRSGVPANPGAWLVATAKRRAIDVLRQRRLHADKREVMALDPSTAEVAWQEPDLPGDAPVPDDVLRLMFIACHPVLGLDARVALTLRLVAGLTTQEIARAFVAPEPTIAQRIVRAKRTLAEARVPFALPSGAELGERLAAVLEVLYLVFNEGYAATSGDRWMRPELCDDALRLARILAALAPREAEAHGLVALMEIQSSRLGTRLDARGEPVLLLDQDRRRWDRLLIQRGLAALARAEAAAEAATAPLGPYALQAAIAACHARAPTAAATDWPRIVALYDALVELTGSPVVELNRAVAVSKAFGPSAGLELVDALAKEPALARYHLLATVRGDLLLALGRRDEARLEFERAAQMTTNERERALLLARARSA